MANQELARGDIHMQIRRLKQQQEFLEQQLHELQMEDLHRAASGSLEVLVGGDDSRAGEQNTMPVGSSTVGKQRAAIEGLFQ